MIVFKDCGEVIGWGARQLEVDDACVGGRQIIHRSSNQVFFYFFESPSQFLTCDLTISQMVLCNESSLYIKIRILTSTL